MCLLVSKSATISPEIAAAAERPGAAQTHTAPIRADQGALPGQGERRRPRTLVIVLFVTEKYNADDRERTSERAPPCFSTAAAAAPAADEWQLRRVDDGEQPCARPIVGSPSISEFAPGLRDANFRSLLRPFSAAKMKIDVEQLNLSREKAVRST